jgi:hypothetical protein
MYRQRKPTAKELPASTYIIISCVGFFVSILCVYYYFHSIENNVTEQTSQKAFYLVLILFGISASAIVFGAMNSYGVLKGRKLGTEFQFAGPAVGVILVVLGGFYLPKSAKQETISIRVLNEQNIPVTNGKVILYFSHYTREQLIDDKGSAVFSDLKDDDLASKIKFDIQSDGYSRLVFDTFLKNFATIQLSLTHARVIHISGKVTNADEMPIVDVEVVADGTRFYGTTITDGSYSFDLFDYSIGDKVTLVTSRKDYKDKTKLLTIDKQDMTNVNFVLQSTCRL